MIQETTIEPVGRWLGAKKMAAAVLCHPVTGWLIGAAFGHRIPHRGARIQVPTGGDPRVNAALFWGIYESAEIRFVREFLDGATDTVELGSSLGGVSIEIARRLHPGRKLVCVEANPRLIELLRANLQRNAPAASTRVIQGAIDYGGSAAVEFTLGESNLSSRVGPGAKTQQVPALTLGAVLTQAGIDDFALVCDIEGAEAAVFDRDASVLSRCKLIIIELHATRYGSVAHTPDTLIEVIVRQTGMRLAARYAEVCTFVR